MKMIIRFRYYTLLLVLTCFTGLQETISQETLKAGTPLTFLEIRLQKDIEDTRLDDFSRIEAAFILSGVRQPDSLDYYLHWYNQLVHSINQFPFDRFDRVNAASQVFTYLHTTWLKTYQKESTDLLAVVRTRQYNCVAGTILYNLICEDLGWDTEAFETPTHVYTLFSDFTHEITVENTSSMGFNIMKNLYEYSKYLAQFYPEREVYRIGLDRLYAYENSQGRIINNTELLGLLAYNRAYFARKTGDYALAYELVLLAQEFNCDSRSNQEFERSLYYTWGKALFDQKQYSQAFTVFADGAYRYPDNTDFKLNTRATFFQSLYIFWQNHQWPETARLINEIISLNIIEDSDKSRLTDLLNQWMEYSSQIHDTDHIKVVEEMINKIKYSR
jgi:hypothetical protein